MILWPYPEYMALTDRLGCLERWLNDLDTWEATFRVALSRHWNTWTITDLGTFL